MKQVIYSVIVLLAVINSLANASERQNPSPQPLLRRALSSKNVSPVNLWQEEVLADDSVKNTVPYLERTVGVYGYPNTELISFSKYCSFDGSDDFAIENVKDLLECGTRFCFGNRLCSHFAYEISKKKCWLKSKFGYGTKSWATKHVDAHCGFIPVRACNVNSATNIAKLLSCLTLDV